MTDTQPDTPAPSGHNAGGSAGDHLRSFVERIERLEAEKSELAGDVREVFAEAKSAGFDTKAMRHVIRIRKMNPSDRQEHEAIVDTYLHALGMAD